MLVLSDRLRGVRRGRAGPARRPLGTDPRCDTSQQIGETTEDAQHMRRPTSGTDQHEGGAITHLARHRTGDTGDRHRRNAVSRPPLVRFRRLGLSAVVLLCVVSTAIAVARPSFGASKSFPVPQTATVRPAPASSRKAPVDLGVVACPAATRCLAIGETTRQWHKTAAASVVTTDNGGRSWTLQPLLHGLLDGAGGRARLRLGDDVRGRRLRHRRLALRSSPGPQMGA